MRSLARTALRGLIRPGGAYVAVVTTDGVRLTYGPMASHNARRLAETAQRIASDPRSDLRRAYVLRAHGGAHDLGRLLSGHGVDLYGIGWPRYLHPSSTSIGKYPGPHDATIRGG